MGLFRMRSKKGRALLDDDDDLPESAPPTTTGSSSSSRIFKSRSAPRNNVGSHNKARDAAVAHTRPNGGSILTGALTRSLSTGSGSRNNSRPTLSSGNHHGDHTNHPNGSGNNDRATGSHNMVSSLEPPSLEWLPQLVEDLKQVVGVGVGVDGMDRHDTSGDVAARTLRMLFSLSEHGSHSDHRTALVRDADGQLVPVLLDFLGCCERSSSEQYLVLLVLNNISIPSENKRMIAIDCGGAQVLSRLLCDDPSCHLMAIILVNLTFADADLRNELVSPRSSIELVEALSYALRVASLSPAEHNNREPLSVADENGSFPPRKLLAHVMAEDHRQRRNWNDSQPPSQNNTARQHDWDVLQKSGLVFDASKQLYPETARWCLCALKNLTRPSRDALSAHALMDTGIVPLLLRIITVGGYIPGTHQQQQQQYSSSTRPPSNPPLSPNPHDTGSKKSKQPFDPPSSTIAKPTALVTTGLLDDEIPSVMNSPASWDSNSMHDAALFTILNMSVIPAARQYLREEDAVHILSLIADYRKPRSSSGSVIAGVPSTPMHDNDPTIHSELKQQQLQSLKARMALAYLVGSEGHYGQPRSRSSSTSIYANPDSSVLHVSGLEAEGLVELLANTLHHRAKDGPGGYSAATFTVKGTLYAIRCLLTNHTNQVTFFATTGVKLNALLLKAVALHSIQQVLTIDAEAAEHACFSLYLQSYFGFKNRFLPLSIREGDDDYDTLTEKVLSSYLAVDNITPPARHATEQLLLRKRHLTFGGSVSELGAMDGAGPSKADFSFSGDLLRGVSRVVMEPRQSGARPLDEIFDRPIVRSRPPKRGSLQHEMTVRSFPSALHAVQELSFGSSKVRHMNAIDDIVIANNIASSANGLKTESYNYYWSWKDASRGKDFERPSSSQVKNLLERVKSSTMREDEPFSIFGLKCGPTFCAADTST